MMKYFAIASLFAATCVFSFEIKNNVERYGWLDQYSMDTRHNFIGNEACVPTTGVNGMTYLQNANFGIFGSSLTGLGYNNWEKADDYLISAMGTTRGDGTKYYRFVYALNEYIRTTKGYPEVQFSGVFPKEEWFSGGGYPKPKYIRNGIPTVAYLTNAIASGSAVFVSIEYDNGNGHEILANGIKWDEKSQTGKLYFIDPLDTSKNYSPNVPTGPVKQSSGELTMDPSGKLVLRYSQYSDRLPYTDRHENVKASLYGALSVGGARYIQYGSVVRERNRHAVAKGFDKLNPTTASMQPILAVLNTSSTRGLNKAFEQLDPSAFSSILLNEQEISLETRKMLTNNVRQYQPLCCHSHCGEEVRIWGAPYGTHWQRRSQNGISGYKARIRGVVGGMDYYWNDFIIGSGGSYAKSEMNFKSAPVSNDIRNIGAFLYGAWMQRHYWVDASFGCFNNKVQASRYVAIPSRNAFIPSVASEFSHKNNSLAFLGHVGAQYTVGCFNWMDFDFSFWPFVNLDYLTAHHRKFTEEGDGVLAYTVHSATQQVFLPQIGIGKSVNCELNGGYQYFSHATLNYTQEVRCGNRHLTAHFCGSPRSRFKVAGLYPQNGYFSPMLLLGIKSPCDYFKVHAGYEGSFGPHLSVNEFSGEVSLAF